MALTQVELDNWRTFADERRVVGAHDDEVMQAIYNKLKVSSGQERAQAELNSASDITGQDLLRETVLWPVMQDTVEAYREIVAGLGLKETKRGEQPSDPDLSVWSPEEDARWARVFEAHSITRNLGSSAERPTIVPAPKETTAAALQKWTRAMGGFENEPVSTGSDTAFLREMDLWGEQPAKKPGLLTWVKNLLRK